ncbi:oligosaccharide flippase family protein, partial [Salmonella enterica]|nr:oligosaccharide flippase family protein [Salmonella enterica]
MAIVGIAIIPMYLSMLGSAGFGLVSFFTLLQTLLVVLDLGISSTLSREVAILKTESTYFSVFIKILTFVMLLFVFVSFMITFFMYIFRDTIATKWLNTSELSLNDVEYSLAIIGIIISLRWCAGPFKSVILGCEEQIKFNLVNIIVTTLRFIVVIPVMYYYGKNVRVFFTYQLVAAVVEFLL